jgi:catechol 2,3-dioxygenase-like lactoylglutathione lyase family enzyme
MKTHTFALNLSAARDEVFSFLADASHLPVWTGGFHAEPRRAGACWQTTTPFGEASVALLPDLRTGVIDLLHGDHPDELAVMPVRVLLRPHGCAVTLTLFQAADMPDEFFEYECRAFGLGFRALAARFGGGELQTPILGATPCPGIVTAKFYETWDFYTTHLGFRTVDESDQHVMLAHGTGGQLLIVREEIDGLPAELVSATNGRGVWLCFDVADTDAEHSRLAAAGVDIVEAPVDRPWGRRHCLIRDPNGMIVSLSHGLTAYSRAAECRPAAS